MLDKELNQNMHYSESKCIVIRILHWVRLCHLLTNQRFDSFGCHGNQGVTPISWLFWNIIEY